MRLILAALLLAAPAVASAGPLAAMPPAAAAPVLPSPASVTPPVRGHEAQAAWNPNLVPLNLPPRVVEELANTELQSRPMAAAEEAITLLRQQYGAWLKQGRARQ